MVVACIPLLGQHRHHVEMLSDVVAWMDSWGYTEVSYPAGRAHLGSAVDTGSLSSLCALSLPVASPPGNGMTTVLVGLC